MTVTTITNRIDAVGDGVVTVYPYNFLVYDESHLFVYLDGVLQTTGFVITNDIDNSNGFVTFTPAPASGVAVALIRVVPLTQLIDYTAYDPFPAETHERGLDLGVMRDQQNAESDGRELRVPGTDPEPGLVPEVSIRANKLLGFDENGDPVASLSDVDDVDALVAEGLAQGSLMSSFSFVGDGSAVDFIIGGVQINHEASILAFIDGVSQNPNVDYTVQKTGGDTTATFTTAPPNLSDVRLHVIGFSKPVIEAQADNTIYTPHDGAPGTKSRFVDEKLDEIISVADYGAVGDGVTDDTAAIQAANDRAEEFGSAAVIFFPPTQPGYLVTSTITIDFVTKWKGAIGYTGTRSWIKVTDDLVSPLSITLTASGTVIEDLAIIGPGATSDVTGINFFNANSCILSRVEIRLFNTGVDYITGANSCFLNTIRDSRIISNNLANINGRANTNGLMVDATTFGGGPAAFGIRMLDSNSLTVLGGDVEGCTAAAIQIDATTPINVGALIAGTHIENNTSSLGDIDLGSSNEVKGITITGCLFKAGSGSIAGINAANVDGLVIAGGMNISGYADVGFYKPGNVTNVFISGVANVANIGFNELYNYGPGNTDADFDAPTVYIPDYITSGRYGFFKINTEDVVASKTYFEDLSVIRMVNVGGAPATPNAIYAKGAFVSENIGSAANVRGFLCSGAFDQKDIAVNYAAAMNTIASNGNLFSAPISNNNAHNFEAPINPVKGQVITWTVRNISAGAIQTSTWDAVFKMSPWVSAGAGTSRSITFKYDGTFWIEISRTPADVPN